MNTVKTWTAWLVRLQLLVVAIVVLGWFSGRLGVLSPLNTFFLFALGVLIIALIGFVALIATVISFLASRPQWRQQALIAFGLGVLPLAAVIVTVGADNFSKPPIHDISTDLDSPPEFVAAVAKRSDSENSLTYGGDEVAQLQRQHYPDIAPIQTNLSAPDAFERSLATVEKLGWRVLAKDADSGRIEAYEETSFIGFIDDIVIRIETNNGGSRIDVRSVSRVGQGDLGANAERIRRFQKAFEQPGK